MDFHQSWQGKTAPEVTQFTKTSSLMAAHALQSQTRLADLPRLSGAPGGTRECHTQGRERDRGDIVCSLLDSMRNVPTWIRHCFHTQVQTRKQNTTKGKTLSQRKNGKISESTSHPVLQYNNCSVLAKPLIS